jgi:hypothetical protein
MSSVCNTFHYAAMTGDTGFLSPEILFWFCVSLPNVSEILSVSTNPTKRNQKPKDQANGLAKRCRHRRYFGRSLYKVNARWTADHRTAFVSNDVRSWTYSEFSLHSLSRLPPVLRALKWWIHATSPLTYERITTVKKNDYSWTRL